MVFRQTTCRCCLTEFANSSELHEFSGEFSLDNEIEDPSSYIRISECYTSVTTITIPEELENDTKMCHPCLEEMKSCMLFMKKCQNSDVIYNQEVEDEIEIFMKSENEYPDCIEFVEEETLNEETSDGYGDPLTRSEYEEALTDDSSVMTNQKSTKAKSHVKSSARLAGRHAVAVVKLEKSTNNRKMKVLHNCKKCDQHFSTLEQLKDHIRSHSSDEKSFQCELCPKNFKNRYQLTLHIRSHTGEKPFVCHLCNRGFSMSSNLQKHVDTHSTDKPYECGICNQFFKTQRSLKFHTVCYHQPEVKVKCTLCPKTFVNKSYLKMHMLYHTGQKNYTCSLCNSKYYKSSHLKRHVQNVHMKLRLMKCEFCASDFVRKETYRSHINSHHKKDLSDEEYREVLERIKTFQAPPLDIKKYTLEKQGNEYEEGEDIGDEMEMIETEDDNVLEEGETEEIYYEEEEDM